MKRFFTLLLVSMSFILSSTQAQQTWDYTYTGSSEQITLPAGRYKLEVWGAQGGAAVATTSNHGGYSSGEIVLTSSTTVIVNVGGQATTTSGGYNGGGSGDNAGIGGGGASDLRIGGTAITDRIIVAGGGGGSGFWSGVPVVGGYGGGLSGGPGYRNTTATPGGDPGTQTSSGNGTCSSIDNPAVSGGLGYGGSTSNCGCDGYGGGGGYYGGAAGGNCRGGGGGSGYTSPSLSSPSLLAGNTSMPNPSGGSMTGRAGNGYARITQLYSVNIVEASSIDCNGLSTGELTASVSGGISPFSIQWSNGDTTTTISGLSAGTYSVTVTDSASNIVVDTFDLTEPAALVAMSNVDSLVTCNGLSDGGAVSTANGGTAPYTYAWSNGWTTNSITGMAAGTYTATITDANGCTASTSSTITEPAVLVAAISADPISCNGLVDGQITAAPTGGTSAYTYTWSTGSTSGTVNNLGAGTYSVTVTDANGCTASNSGTIAEPTVLTATSQVVSNVLCNGATDGEVSASPSGGTSAYTYSWSNGATTSSAANLAAGTYTVTVTDANGCTATSQETITEPTALVATSQVVSDVSCNGLSDGGATASATGGTSSYTYAWSNSAATASITGVAAGTYSVTVTDANGCTSTSSATVTEPTVLVASSQVDSNVTCNGLSDGGTTASATGGTTPYTYAWSNTAATASVTGVTAGTYSITITDANGCTSTSSATVTEPTVLVASTQVDSNVTCNGLSDAGATASATGGTSPYTYVWSNAATTASITGVTAGTYSVTVTDANGCAQVAVDTLVEPAVLTASATVLANQPCYGDTNGVVVVDAFGGTQPYTYQWSNGDTADNIQSIAAGTYYVTATDSNGCSIVDTAIVTEPAILTISLDSLMDVNCFGDSTGYAAVSANGGTTPYVFNWSNGTTGLVDSMLYEGNFTVTVTDNNNCMADTAFEVGYLHELPVVDLGNDIDTNISEVTVTLPDTFVTYLWNTGADSNSITVYDIGTYSVVVSDSNGCYNSDSIYISLWPTGIKGVDGKEAGVSIYPNPSHGVFTLETFNMDNERVEWMVVNINGQLVKQGVLGSDMDKQSIDLTGNARGVYFLIGKSNSVSFNTRIVVQ